LTGRPVDPRLLWGIAQSVEASPIRMRSGSIQ
jgi:hypothetical protein